MMFSSRKILPPSAKGEVVLKTRYIPIYVCSLVMAFSAASIGETITLKASKDNFCRSNERARNSGANTALYVAHAPVLRTLVAFDLSPVTNRIVEAAFRFRQGDTGSTPVSLTIAPMVHTPGNSAWAEGSGALGSSGQNARPGESCYGWRAFPDRQWEDDAEKPVPDLGHARLWAQPVVSGKRLQWNDGAWIEIGITDAAMLEKIRTSSTPSVTLGMWGTSGSGLYAIRSKESGDAPELVLVIEEGR